MTITTTATTTTPTMTATKMTAKKKPESYNKTEMNSNGFCMDDANVSLVFGAQFCCVYFILYFSVAVVDFFSSSSSSNRSDICIHTNYTVYIVELCTQYSRCEQNAFNGNRRVPNGFFNRTITHHISHRQRHKTIKAAYKYDKKQFDEVKGEESKRKSKTKKKKKEKRLRSQTNAAVLSICEI